MICIQVVTTEIHRELSEQMLKAAEAVAPPLDACIANITWVPGSLEVPLAVQELLAVRTAHAFVILGTIQKGETKHGEVLAHAVTSRLLDLQLRYRIPMSIAIIGPCSTPEHASAKASATAQKAMRVAVTMANLVHNLRNESVLVREEP